VSTGGRTKAIAVVIVWLFVIGLGAAAYRVFVVSAATERESRIEALEEYRLLARQAGERGLHVPELPDDADVDEIAQINADITLLLTGSAPITDGVEYEVGLSLDSFSGYAVLRSDAFRNTLAGHSLGLRLVDDGADYTARLDALARGVTPLAVFTVDALLAASGRAGELPGTIVLVIDETVGADAMVAYEDAVPDIDALDRPDARIVVTPDSPSETLARVVLANFSLDALPDDPFVAENGAGEVLERMTSGDRAAPRAYVLWEPYVSKALEEPGTRVIMDSSRFRGFIVDVLVVQREYLIRHEARVAAFVESYLRALHEVARDREAQRRLVRDDARRAGEPLTETQAARLADGIWWKNTQENYAHFGLIDGGSAAELPRLDAMVRSIGDVLVRTGAMDGDPTGGRPGEVLYDRVLRRLRERRFHPGVSGDPEAIRAAGLLRELDDDEWERLVPVGTLAVERIVFARGTARLTSQSKHALRALDATLESFPQYYLVIRGHARREGDLEANRRLAAERAATARSFLVSLGVPEARLRSIAVDPEGSDGRQQTVSFVLGQLPY
jgi:ABC-type nitrate/sulfonate/bicarbonate transport system substrate-binding protein